MTNIAYIRVSSVDQNTDRQLADIKVDKTFTDKCSGSSTDRPALQDLKGWARDGDTVHVHSIDRLARNTQDLLNLVEFFTGNGVCLKFHKESLSFNCGEDSSISKLMLTMLGAVATFERDLIKERQREGIAQAQAKGVQFGRPSVDHQETKAKALELIEQGIPKTQVAKKLGVSRASLYRILG